MTTTFPLFTLIPSKATDSSDKTFCKYQAVKNGTQYRKLLKNGTTRFSICTGGTELWLTADEVVDATVSYMSRVGV